MLGAYMNYMNVNNIITGNNYWLRTTGTQAVSRSQLNRHEQKWQNLILILEVDMIHSHAPPYLHNNIASTPSYVPHDSPAAPQLVGPWRHHPIQSCQISHCLPVS
jgi:hypothetical protein